MTCWECGSKEGPFKKDKSHTEKGICKSCHSHRTRLWQKGKAAKMSPHKWFNCDDCEEIFNIKRQDGKLHTCCPYCKSEEIQTFAEQEGLPNYRVRKEVVLH